jgi:hypothetical protein
VTDDGPVYDLGYLSLPAEVQAAVEAHAAEPEYGRLDRILAAQQADAPHPLDPPPGWRRELPYGWARSGPHDEPVERLRSMVAALEAECAAKDNLIGALTHEYESYDGGPCEHWVTHPLAVHYVECRWPADAPVHRTPAVVRAEMEGQA